MRIEPYPQNCHERGGGGSERETHRDSEVSEGNRDGRERERDRETDRRQTERVRQTSERERDKQTETDTHRERSA